MGFIGFMGLLGLLGLVFIRGLGLRASETPRPGPPVSVSLSKITWGLGFRV